MTDTSNSELPWDAFDSTEYFEHNYNTLCDEDQAVLEIVQDFFAAALADAAPRMRGIDVGAGTNIYPTLSMLPWCDEITLVDRSVSNVTWLRDEVANYKESWDPFWDVLQKNDHYSRVLDPRRAVEARAKVEQGDVFHLPTRRWDLGTMFFVACSFSSMLDECESGVRSFLDALRPGSPFVMAYMEQSQGYRVGNHRFPAVSLTADDVRCHLEELVDELKVTRMPASKERLRPGYEGMLVAHGRTRRSPE